MQPPPCREFARGFTLLEILVVVAILAIAGAVVALTITTDERGTLEREARRFAGALEYAALRAQARNETLGISASTGPDGSQWRFLARAADGRWRTIVDDAPLAARVLPRPVTVAPWTYGGREIAPDAVVPLRASGRNEPYAFVLRVERLDAIVGADPLNRVSIVGPYARAP